jgi:hypothetical protein
MQITSKKTFKIVGSILSNTTVDNDNYEILRPTKHGVMIKDCADNGAQIEREVSWMLIK